MLVFDLVMTSLVIGFIERKSCMPRSILYSKNKLRMSMEGEEGNRDLASAMAEMDALINEPIGDKVAFDTTSAASAKVPFSKEVAAGIGALLGATVFAAQNINPGVSGAELLRIAEVESIPVSVAACQDKPMVIDFYAPWCENCKQVAPSLRQLEGAYGGDINFITVDGSNPANNDLVGRFHVDGIPHLAFMDSEGIEQTALIGAVPKPILKAELEALVAGKPLPYAGIDNGERPLDLEKGVCSLPTNANM